MPRQARTTDPPSSIFDETLALDDQTFAAVMGAGGLTPYDEYLHELDKIPVLRDPVATSQRILQPDFRQGQRRDARKQPREDGYTLRESHTGELEALYREYATPPKPPKRAKAAAKRSKPRRRKKK